MPRYTEEDKAICADIFEAALGEAPAPGPSEGELEVARKKAIKRMIDEMGPIRFTG